MIDEWQIRLVQISDQPKSPGLLRHEIRSIVGVQSQTMFANAPMHPGHGLRLVRGPRYRVSRCDAD